MTTPKESFLASAHRPDWEKIVNTKAAQEARNAALLEFVSNQPAANSPAIAWDAHSQLVGARAILDLLFSMHLKEEPKEPLKMTHLPIPK